MSFLQLDKNSCGWFDSLFTILPKSFNTASSEWAFSDIRISTDINSAHISYINDGKFLSHDSILTEMKWLETGYMVKTNDGLKMKFMSSDNIATKLAPSGKWNASGSNKGEWNEETGNWICF